MFRTACPGYTPPSSKKLRTRLLDKTLKGLDEEMKILVEKAPVVSIVSDGWSNIRNDHLVNFVVTIPNCKPILYKAIETTEISQTGEAIYQELKKVIQEIGPEKVCSVVTDNASNMQAAWNLIEKEYPFMFANGCAAHVLNLLVKDILQISAYEETLRNAVDVSKFIKARGALCKEFRNIQAQSSSIKKKRFLSLPVETRWYTQYQCLKNVLDNRETLSMICVTNVFRKKYSKIESARSFKSLIENDEFWTNLQKLALILKPICDGIGVMEKDRGFLSDVYKTFLNLLSHSALQDKNVRDLVEDRWNFIHTEAMGFAYLLDPRQLGGRNMFGNDKENTLQELQSYMEKAHSDSVEVNNYLESWSYASDTFISAAMKNSPLLTWGYYFAEKFPKLYLLARRLFAIPTSSAASERVWSVFSFIHSKKRCRLVNSRVMNLAKVYVNTSISRMETSKARKEKAIDYFQELPEEIEEDEEPDSIDIF